MKILNLQRKKLGDSYPIVQVTYKNGFKKVVRDAVFSDDKFWKWCDTGHMVDNDVALKIFDASGDFDYEVNRKI